MSKVQRNGEGSQGRVKYIVMLRIEDQGEIPHLLRLASFTTRRKAQNFMDPLREFWGSSTYIEERYLEEENE